MKRIFETYIFVDEDGIQVKTSAISEVAARQKINKIRRKFKKKISKLIFIKKEK